MDIYNTWLPLIIASLKLLAAICIVILFTRMVQEAIHSNFNETDTIGNFFEDKRSLSFIEIYTESGSNFFNKKQENTFIKGSSAPNTKTLCMKIIKSKVSIHAAIKKMDDIVCSCTYTEVNGENDSG